MDKLRSPKYEECINVIRPQCQQFPWALHYSYPLNIYLFPFSNRPQPEKINKKINKIPIIFTPQITTDHDSTHMPTDRAMMT